MALALVVTRTKNRPLLLERAITSVISQNYLNWKHVVVNDGGDPLPVKRLIEKYADAYKGRVQTIHNPSSVGMEAASNIGIRSADSEFILIHDDDDSLAPEFLERTVSYLASPPYPTIQGVCTWANQVTEVIDGDNVNQTQSRIFRDPRGALSIADIAGANPIPPISFLFRRSATEQIGLFDETLPVLGDWEFLIRFLSQFDVGVIPEPLANYHLRPSSTGSSANSITDRSERFELLTKIIRNRYAREQSKSALGVILQLSEPMRRVQRIYSHPILGRIIRLWSKFINPDIPKSPF